MQFYSISLKAKVISSHTGAGHGANHLFEANKQPAIVPRVTLAY